jgi:CRISPR-associated protein Cmr1
MWRPRRKFDDHTTTYLSGSINCPCALLHSFGISGSEKALSFDNAAPSGGHGIWSFCMKTLKATFQIVTPMFLGGADHVAQSIRPASVKGALRFWWRALNWSRLLKQNADDEVQALRSLHAEEARLFGIAAGDSAGGQGIFMMQVHAATVKATSQPFETLDNGKVYLLGMGLAKYESAAREVRLTRNALAAKGVFEIKCLFRPSVNEPDFLQIRETLLMFGLLGALGSRARHGMGSLAMTDWSEKQALPKTVEEYKVLIKSVLGSAQAKTEPPFTAFSGLSRIDFSQTHADVAKLLSLIGTEQQLYRSYGQKGIVSGKPSERNFSDDHDLVLKATNGERIDKAPKRIVFGLPHNYFFSSSKDKADINYSADGKSDDRRASPLMLHIHPVGDMFVAVHTLLPAKFLPDLGKIRIKARVTSSVEPKPDWGVLHTYLNRFMLNGGTGETIHG